MQCQSDRHTHKTLPVFSRLHSFTHLLRCNNHRQQLLVFSLSLYTLLFITHCHECWGKKAPPHLLNKRRLHKCIRVVNYVMNRNGGCGLPKSAEVAQRYKKRRFCPWTTPNALKLNCGLPSYNSTLITEVEPALFVCTCLYVWVWMTCMSVCSAGVHPSPMLVGRILY